MKTKSLNILTILWLFLANGLVLSGQSRQISQNYFLNQGIINPATLGSEFYPVAQISVEKKWMGFKNAPSMQMLGTSLRIGNFDFYNPKMFLNKSRLKAAERIGMGAFIYNNNEGPVSARGLKMGYSYHVPFNNSRLSFGLSGSFNQYVLDQSVFQPVQNIDPLIDYSKENLSLFNADAGIYYYRPEFFAGFSAVNLFPVTESTRYNVKTGPDFWLHGGYLFRNLGSIMVEPSLFMNLRNDESFFYDLNMKVYYNYVNWISFTYRSYKAIRMHLGIKARQIYFMYSTEINITQISRYNFGTHEIGLGINIGIRRIEGF